MNVPALRNVSSPYVHLIQPLSNMSREVKLPRNRINTLPLAPRTYEPLEKVEMTKEFMERKIRIRTDEIIRHGRQTIPRRSDFLEWNYESETYSFAVRLGEKFDHRKLREAFIDQSYADQEREKHIALGMDLDGEPMSIVTNDRLAKLGGHFLTQTLAGYVRAALPFWPEEGIQALVNFLNSNEVQAEISFHIGARDLIMATDYPADRPTYAKVFRAIVGALLESSDESRAQRFVYDFVAPQLHGLDINEIWEIPDPMRILMSILSNEGREAPESRLLWSSAPDTIMATFHVGIYSNRELIGQAPGESVEIAEEMASRDALRRIFRSDDSMPMIPLGDYLTEDQVRPKPNPNVSEWSTEKASTNLHTV